MTVTVSREWSVGADIAGLIGGNFGSSNDMKVRISGDSGTREQLKEYEPCPHNVLPIPLTTKFSPQKFLDYILQNDPEVRTCLRRWVSISRTIYYVNRLSLGKSRYPQIWFVTGLQTIADGKIFVQQNDGSYRGVFGTVPMIDPVSQAAQFLASGEGLVNVQWDDERKEGFEQDYGYKGDRIWAAQYMRLRLNWEKRSGTAMLDDTAPPYTHIEVDDLPDFKHGTLAEDNERFTAEIQGLGTGPENSPAEKNTEIVDGAMPSKLKKEFPEENDPVENMTDEDWRLVKAYLQYYAAQEESE